MTRFRAQAIPARAAKPLGPAQDWSDADRDRLATVTERDQASARDFWRRHAPLTFRNLLDAKRWGGDGS